MRRNITPAQYARISEYLAKWDSIMTQRDNSIVLSEAHRLDTCLSRLCIEYVDIQCLFWNLEMARNIVKDYSKRLLLL